MTEVMNADRVGKIAAELMEALEINELPEDGDVKAEIGVVAVVAEITVHEDDGPGRTYLHYRCSDPRRWLQEGLFRMAVRAVRDNEL